MGLTHSHSLAFGTDFSKGKYHFLRVFLTTFFYQCDLAGHYYHLIKIKELKPFPSILSDREELQ